MNAGSPRYVFGPFVLNPGRGILLRHGIRVALTPRTLRLLEVLVGHAGEVLDKDDLIRRVWAGTIVEENNLARQVSSLRKALREVPGSCTYVATVPGVGYRFVAPVTEVDPDAQVAAERTARSGLSTRVLEVAALVLVIAVVASALVRRHAPAAGAASAQRSMRQLTFGAGLQQNPAWSRDGRQIAFASDRFGNLDIWVQRVGASEPARLTSWPGREWEPDWSPDGRWIAFQSDHEGGGLYIVSAEGGEPRRLSTFGRRPLCRPLAIGSCSRTRASGPAPGSSISSRLTAARFARCARMRSSR